MPDAQYAPTSMAVRIPASSIRYRKEFNLVNKDVNETLENWYDRLKVLSERCEFGAHSEAFILHQFLCGLDVLTLEDLYVEQKDLSLMDVFDLTENLERKNDEPADFKAALLSIKEEENEPALSDDGEHFNDNTYGDSDNDDKEHEATNEAISDETTQEGKQDENGTNDVARKHNILAIVPFGAETVIELPDIPRLFECYLCHKTWPTTGHIMYHFTRYHTLGKTSQCHLCGKWVQDPSNMVRHLNMHFNTKQYRCSICDSEFARSISLTKHLQLHKKAGSRQFKCSKCSKLFITKHHLKEHQKTHDTPAVSFSERVDEIVKKVKLQKAKAVSHGTFKCDLCSASFEKESSLNSHAKVHCEDQWLCHLCGKKLMNKRNLIHHYQLHANEKPFTCEECGRTFSFKEKLKLHMKGHSDVRPHACTHCDKSFVQKCHLARHMKVHFPDPKFKCDQCPKEFLKKEALFRHILVHVELNPLGCNYCEKTFKSKCHRIEHERTHTGEKPFQCTTCDKCFAKKSSLRCHEKTHTGEKPFRCTTCDNSFARNDTLRDHERTHTGEKPFRCTTCGKSFGKSSSLRSHEETHLEPKVERPKKKRKPKQKTQLEHPFE